LESEHHFVRRAQASPARPSGKNIIKINEAEDMKKERKKERKKGKILYSNSRF
jgi:hypothetical protein